ncbi:adenine/guanine phosphoribosyltransferase-like PRPP-binding protein [Deinobacterium chartae]|uniref:Adenine/guanine phosphoribosyltransferase-like PRPP-binding protein n=1 Tax=Deinobacterium chartae TaxID=521158 RepID=A0A841I004_9DEIO|nr:hypothetical protein [Deinobacterium chartae]MBB6098274.1 adenine/guanine phosphoribosyltransferase-like PRPP-binding protein [Deinobacterium chartae]
MNKVLLHHLSAALEDEHTLEARLSRLRPTEWTEAAAAFNDLPAFDTVLTLPGTAHNLGFALAQAHDARLALASERPPVGPACLAEVDGHTLFSAQADLEGAKQVLIVRDVLRHGYASLALVGLVAQIGATVTGCVSALEFTRYGGRNHLELMDVPVFAGVRIAHVGAALQLERRHLPENTEELLSGSA